VTFRPDLVATWVVRVPDAAHPAVLEILLLRRAPGRPLPGLWQCVTGRLEPEERVALGALRELAEETGIEPGVIEAFYDLDLVSHFHWSSLDAVLSEVMFAVVVRSGTEPVLSHEHDDWRWVSPDEAIEMTVWPAYREAIDRIRTILPDVERRRWFATSLSGERLGS
jgi:dATP pyrophosphohydrolase